MKLLKQAKHFYIYSTFGKIKCTLLNELICRCLRMRRKHLLVLLKSIDNQASVMTFLTMNGCTEADKRSTNDFMERARLPFSPSSMIACAACNKKDVQFSACGACNEIWYYSKQCQRDDWRLHKEICKLCAKN